MTPIRHTARRTFEALSVRNYRLYFVGQVISVSGTWMQTVALSWLVLRLTHSPVDLGLVTALQFLPMLLFGTWGGLVADRVNKRRLLIATQCSFCVVATVLALLDISGTIRLWEVYSLAVLFGVVNLFDNPARQTFVAEMVGRDLLPNAVSLNSVIMNSARIVGPALAGIVIATLGTGICFLANAGSYAAVLVALALIRSSELHRTPVVARAKGQLKEGFRYVWSTPELRDPLAVMALVGVFAFNFTVTLALMARYAFDSGAGTYGALTSAMGAGAIFGGLYVAHRSRPNPASLGFIGLLFGSLIVAVSLAPTTIWAMVLLVPMGAASIAFVATSNGTLQLGAEPQMRGRVMSLFAIAFLGSTPIGAPLVGAISAVSSPRWALAVGGVVTLAASLPLLVKYRRRDRARRAAGSSDELRSPTARSVA